MQNGLSKAPGQCSERLAVMFMVMVVARVLAVAGFILLPSPLENHPAPLQVEHVGDAIERLIVVVRDEEQRHPARAAVHQTVEERQHQRAVLAVQALHHMIDKMYKASVQFT